MSEKEGNEDNKQQNSAQPLAALAYPTEEERNVTLEPNQPRQPHSLQDLLRFSVEASRAGQNNTGETSAPVPTLASLDEERRRFLENALKSLTIDVIEELLKSIQILQRAGNLELEEDPTECEQELEKIASYVDHIDIANDFHKIGGFCIFQPCLNSPHSSLRWRAAEVIAELTQNNPYCQERILESRLLPVLLSLVDTDPNTQVRIKALYALSCLIRESDKALSEFAKLEGYSVLMRAMQSDIEKLQIKSSFLLSYICSRCPSVKDELCKMGFVVQLAGLVREGSPPALEHLLSALLALVKDHEPSKEECRSAQLQLKSTLANLLRQNSDKDERRVQIYKTDDGSSTGTVGAVSEKIISNQVTPSSNETDSDPTYYHDTPFTSLETIVSTVPVDVENASTATELSETQETPTQHKYGKRRPKRTLNEVYEKVQDMADSQVKKNKKKLMEMCSESDMKLKICETGLKMKEEELVARRRKYDFEEEEFSLRKKKYELEEEESRLRKAILKVELELAKAKLDNEKHSSV